MSLDEEDAGKVKVGFEEELEAEFPLTEDLEYVGEELAERVRIDPKAATCLQTVVVAPRL